MKVSNNALNFLLAQYRAIFKRAYVKGLASAVMLTAALAAGQAQAAAALNNDELSSLAEAKDILVGTNDGDAIADFTLVQISGTAAAAVDESWNANVTVNSGAAADSTGNFIKADAGKSVSLTGSGSLTIDIVDAQATSNGLILIGNGATNDANLELELSKINVTRGTLTLSGSTSGTVTAAAGEITIGSSSSTATQGTPDGIVVLTNAASNGDNVTLGNASSHITVEKGGQLKLSGGAAGDMTVTGAELTVANGGLFLVAAGTNNKITADDLNVESGGSFVVDYGAAAATGIFSGKGAQVDGNLYVASGSTLQLDTTPTTVEGEEIQGTVTLGANSNTQIGGTLTVNSGTLKVDSGADLHASDEGAIKVLDSDDADTNETTLQIYKDVLKNFLTADRPVTTITATGSTGSGTSAAGGVVLSGATLEFTGTEQVKLTDYSFQAANNNNAVAGVIVVNSGSTNTIVAKDILIDDTLKSGGTSLTSGSGIAVEATNLTLGSSSYTSTGKDLGFASATAKNLNLVSDSTGFGLKNAITLDVTMGGNSVVGSETGMVTGNFVVTSDGPLTFKHGTYNPDSDITI